MQERKIGTCSECHNEEVPLTRFKGTGEKICWTCYRRKARKEQDEADGRAKLRADKKARKTAFSIFNLVKDNLDVFSEAEVAGFYKILHPHLQAITNSAAPAPVDSEQEDDVHTETEPEIDIPDDVDAPVNIEQENGVHETPVNSVNSEPEKPVHSSPKVMLLLPAHVNSEEEKDVHSSQKPYLELRHENHVISRQKVAGCPSCFPKDKQKFPAKEPEPATDSQGGDPAPKSTPAPAPEPAEEPTQESCNPRKALPGETCTCVLERDAQYEPVVICGNPAVVTCDCGSWCTNGLCISVCVEALEWYSGWHYDHKDHIARKVLVDGCPYCFPGGSEQEHEGESAPTPAEPDPPKQPSTHSPCPECGAKYDDESQAYPCAHPNGPKKTEPTRRSKNDWYLHPQTPMEHVRRSFWNRHEGIDGVDWKRAKRILRALRRSGFTNQELVDYLRGELTYQQVFSITKVLHDCGVTTVFCKPGTVAPTRNQIWVLKGEPGDPEYKAQAAKEV